MIKDEFTRLKGKVSRQYIWQLRQKRDGKCQLCAEKRVTKTHCLKHAILARERVRAFQGNKKRINSLTYRLEKRRRNGRAKNKRS